MHECSVCYSVKEDRTQKQHIPCGLVCTECVQLWSWCTYYILQIASDSLFMSRVHSWHSDSSCDNHSLKKKKNPQIHNFRCIMHSEASTILPNNVNDIADMLSSIVHGSDQLDAEAFRYRSNIFPKLSCWFYACFMDLREHSSLCCLSTWEHSCQEIRACHDHAGGEKYSPHPLPLYCFLEDHSIAADSCPGINGQTNITEQTGHLKSLGPECFRRMSSYRKSSFFILDPCDYSSSRGYTCEHWFSYKAVQVNTSPVEQLRAAADTENDRMAVHHSFLADGNYVRIGPSPWMSRISCGPIRSFSEWEAGWHKQVVLPDLLTPAGIPGSLVQFISHNTSRGDSAHWK